ncbi:MAG: 16S rRNA (cytosine(1402)-N(4))-methyltransferase RsmH [Armatimonadota bacterium]
MSTYHVPVMLEECIDGLSIKPGGTYVDATTGGGGHSAAILDQLAGTGKLICLDQDRDALASAKLRLGSQQNVCFVQSNFGRIAEVIAEYSPAGVDGVLFDLGVSSYQLDTPGRGFAIRYNGPLDMRMDQESDAETAADLVNRLPESEIADIFFTYGEESRGRRIAKAIVDARPLLTTEDLVDAVRRAMPTGTRPGQVHPATKVFQALRIAVNSELDVLPSAIIGAINALAIGGRIVVMSYHSLEDRIVKRILSEGAGKAIASDGWTVTDRQKVLNLVTRKGVGPSETELRLNPRSRSAKLRVAERMSTDLIIGVGV